MMVSLVRLGVGAVSLGSDEIAHRLDHAGAQPRRARSDGSAGWIVAGLAIETAEALGRLGAMLSERGRRATAVAGGAARLPGAKMLERRLLALRERGRVETLEGRRMVGLLIRDTTSRSIRGIAQTAVKEVAHSPEVHALVRSESSGLATGTILEVRANSEQADARLERRVRSWLHILRPEHEGERVGAEPSPPREPVA
jgi:hypothetical protein